MSEIVHLEALKVAAYAEVDPYFMRTELKATEVGHMLGLQLTGYVLGRQLEPREIVYPVTWWDAFKHRWFPAWAKRRWPVQWHKWKITAEELYPGHRFSIPDSPLKRVAVYSYDAMPITIPENI